MYVRGDHPFILKRKEQSFFVDRRKVCERSDIESAQELFRIAEERMLETTNVAVRLSPSRSSQQLRGIRESIETGGVHLPEGCDRRGFGEMIDVQHPSNRGAASMWQVGW